MCMEIEHLYFIQFLWLEPSVKVIDEFCGEIPTVVTQWKVNHFCQRKSSPCVAQYGPTYISNTFDNPVVCLRSRHQSRTRKETDFYPAICSFLHLPAPLFCKDTLPCYGRHKVRIV